MRKPKDQLIEATKAVQPTLSRTGRIMRGFSTHVAVAVIVGTLSYGLAAEDAHSASATAIAAERSTLMQLAEYGGCAAKDPTGAWYWRQFPTAMDEQGEPIKVAATKKGKR